MKRTRHFCPRCNHPVRRIHRTDLDRIVNVFFPLKRLQCSQCGWSGRNYRPRNPRRVKERLHAEVIRRRMMVGGLVAGLFVILIFATWYLTLFVWSTPPRSAP
jgi:hypothetical protein